MFPVYRPPWSIEIKLMVMVINIGNFLVSEAEI